MCGFVGIFSKTNKAFPEASLKEMSSMIVHRGPDDSGFFSDGDWASLAFRRLSILDLSIKGHQPMKSSDGRYVIVFNGEVYNYREIRKELIDRSFSFNSDSDTEVVLNSFICWGKDCVKRFVGMFAFIIVDTVDKTAFIARDPLGIKPLFMFENSEYIVFTSELKTLLPCFRLEPDFDNVNEYLVFRSLPGCETLFKNVKNLEPGSFAEFKNGFVRKTEYFDLASTLKVNKTRSFEESCDAVEELLKESVKIHLRSDVELGVQLSGGVDSSLITAIASGMTGKKFHTFSISFEESSYDESEYQKRVSARYNTEHHDYPMNESIFVDMLKQTIWHYEHPLNDPNAVATQYLCKKASDYIKVMLSGEGADESFMGYARFSPEALKRMASRSFLYRHRNLRKNLLKLWPFSKGADLLKISAYNPPMYVLTYANMNLVHKLLKGNDLKMKCRRGILNLAEGDILKQTILQDQICDLMQWFWRADRMGMASSMELRVPFCTEPMFRMANSIPYEQLVYHGERKAILKKIAEKYIDKDQIYRKKVGFGTPVDDWLNKKGVYSELYDSTVNSEKFIKREFINYGHFKDIYDAHRNGSFRERNSGFLWTYFNLELWYQIFFEGLWKQFR